MKDQVINMQYIVAELPCSMKYDLLWTMRPILRNSLEELHLVLP